jgi:hypothetical protein
MFQSKERHMQARCHGPTAFHSHDNMKQGLQLNHNMNCLSLLNCLNWTKLISLVLVRERTIPTERPQPAGEISANF